VKMTKSELKELIAPLSPNLNLVEEGSEFLIVEVQPSELHQVAKQLRDHSKLAFDYLFSLTGVDYGTELGVVYHLESTKTGAMISLKVKTADRENPNFDSVFDLWPAAEYNESEAYDFYGIRFNNHPNLRRLFMDEDWKGWPMRKDYSDDFNMLVR